MGDPPPFRLEIISAPGPGTVTLDGTVYPSITAALADSRPASVISLGRGRYGSDTETFPLRIPAGVTVTGPALPDVPFEARKHLPAPEPARLVGDGVLVDLADGTRLADVQLRRHGGGVALSTDGATDISIESCSIEGSIRVVDTDRTDIRWCTVTNGGIVADNVCRLTMTGGRISGDHGTGIALHAGRIVRIEAVAITDTEVGIHLDQVDGLVISGCAVIDARTGLQGTNPRHFEIVGNHLRADRGLVIEAGRDGSVNANSIEWRRHDVTISHSVDVESASNRSSRLDDPAGW